MDCERGDRVWWFQSCHHTPLPLLWSLCKGTHTLIVKIPQSVIQSAPPQSRHVCYDIHAVNATNNRQLVFSKKAAQPETAKGSAVSGRLSKSTWALGLIKKQLKCLFLPSQSQHHGFTRSSKSWLFWFSLWWTNLWLFYHFVYAVFALFFPPLSQCPVFQPY